jgi:carbon-monoxide dehydrogenase large subunit
MGWPVDQTILTPHGFEDASSGRVLDWRSLADIARARSAPRDIPPGLLTRCTYEADGEAWSSGCCVARVEIDAETGELHADRIVWIDDAGTVVNPILVRGQLWGGLSQGLGEALMERVVYDSQGQLLTASFMDYAIPRAADMPRVEFGCVETPSPMNLLGAKGVGEAGCIGVPAAIVNAAMNALAPLGVDRLDMPLTSHTIWKALQKARTSLRETDHEEIPPQ